MNIVTLTYLSREVSLYPPPPRTDLNEPITETIFITAVTGGPQLILQIFLEDTFPELEVVVKLSFEQILQKQHNSK